MTTESPATIEALPAGITAEAAAGYFDLAERLGSRPLVEVNADRIRYGLKAPAPAQADAEPGADTSGFNLTPAQLKKMSEWAVEDGVMTQDDADKALADAGVDAAAAASDVDKHLAEEGVPPAVAKEFDKLPPLMADPDASVADIATAHQTVTEWLTTAKVSRETGHNLAHVASEFAPKWAAMNESERELHHRTTENLLERAWGDQFTARVHRAQRLVNEIDAKKPGFKQYIETSGLGNDPAFCTLFSNHAELLHGRHIKKGSKK